MRNYFFILSSFLMATSLSVFAETVVIVHPESTITALNSAEISNIFLGKRALFPNGKMCVPIDLPEGDSHRDAFYLKIIGKNSTQLKAYWSRLIFTGTHTPPIELLSSTKVKDFVLNHMDAIGYIDKRDVDTSIKVILELP